MSPRPSAVGVVRSEHTRAQDAPAAALRVTGWADRPPAGADGAYTDYIAPKFTAAVVLAALDRRGRTGEGCYDE